MKEFGIKEHVFVHFSRGNLNFRHEQSRHGLLSGMSAQLHEKQQQKIRVNDMNLMESKAAGGKRNKPMRVDHCLVKWIEV